MQVLHSVITDGHHVAGDSAAAADAIRHRLAMVSDQWQAIWCRVRHRQEAVNMAVGLWQKYQIQLCGLRSHLTQISEVVRANCMHGASLPMQHAQMVRLQVR